VQDKQQVNHQKRIKAIGSTNNKWKENKEGILEELVSPVTGRSGGEGYRGEASRSLVKRE
jgi:hypothetical protein